MGTKHKHADVIHAWAEGEEIESRLNAECEWGENTNPSWNEGIEYRIKPKIVKKEGWVNVYPDKYSNYETEFHFTKNHADRLAPEARVACIHIEWEEEQ